MENSTHSPANIRFGCCCYCFWLAGWHTWMRYGCCDNKTLRHKKFTIFGKSLGLLFRPACLPACASTLLVQCCEQWGNWRCQSGRRESIIYCCPPTYTVQILDQRKVRKWNTQTLLRAAKLAKDSILKICPLVKNDVMISGKSYFIQFLSLTSSNIPSRIKVWPGQWIDT